MSEHAPSLPAGWPYANPAPNPERLGFILCFAAAIHAALILGLSFSIEKPRPALPSIEVTLAKYQSQTRPEEADYIAQFDQEGSGSLEHKAKPSSITESAFHDNQAPEEQALKLAKQAPEKTTREVLKTQGKSSTAVTSAKPQAEIRDAQNGDNDSTQLSQNIAALEAQLAQLNQAYASMPRPKFITSVATRGSPDALYLNRWEAHIEKIGNQYYPEEARKKGIEGELRLLLMLFPDGRVDEVRILHSSGQPVLDRAAHRIVRLAAPYEAVPATVLDGKNRLGIVRTWRFEKASMTAQGG